MDQIRGGLDDFDVAGACRVDRGDASGFKRRDGKAVSHGCRATDLDGCSGDFAMISVTRVVGYLSGAAIETPITNEPRLASGEPILTFRANLVAGAGDIPNSHLIDFS